MHDALTLSIPIGSAPNSNSLLKISILPPWAAYTSNVLLFVVIDLTLLLSKEPNRSVMTLTTALDDSEVISPVRVLDAASSASVEQQKALREVQLAYDAYPEHFLLTQRLIRWCSFEHLEKDINSKGASK